MRGTESIGLVDIIDGYCWYDDIREDGVNEEGNNKNAVVPVCLGLESEIRPILEGKQPIPDTMSPGKQNLLHRITEVKEVGTPIGEQRIQRGSTAGTSRNRTRNTEFSKTRQRVPRGEAGRQASRLSGGRRPGMAEREGQEVLDTPHSRSQGGHSKALSQDCGIGHPVKKVDTK